MSTPRDSSARRVVDSAQAIMLSQFPSIPLNFSFANSPGQPHTQNHLSIYDGQVNEIMPHEEGNVEKRSKRLEKNRESARQCRRRKKEYITTLEERVSELTQRIQELQQKYWYTKEKLTEEQRKVAIELSGIAQVPNKERDCAVLLSRFSDICYKQGTAAIIYHLDQLKELLIPAQQVKFALWGLDQGDEFYESNGRDADSGTIWSVLSKEIGWTAEQGEQLKRMREIVHRENKEIAASILQVEALRSNMCTRLESIQRSINEIRNLFTPQQQAKFVVWVEQNSAVMKMLNTIGTHTWLPEIHSGTRTDPTIEMAAHQPHSHLQPPQQHMKMNSSSNIPSVESQLPISASDSTEPQTKPVASANTAHLQPPTSAIKPKGRAKPPPSNINHGHRQHYQQQQQSYVRGLSHPLAQLGDPHNPAHMDEHVSYQNPLQAQLQSHMQSQIHQSLQNLSGLSSANYPNAAGHMISVFGNHQIQSQAHPSAPQSTAAVPYQNGVFSLSENQSKTYDSYKHKGMAHLNRSGQSIAPCRAPDSHNIDSSIMSRSTVDSSSESDDEDGMNEELEDSEK